MKKNWIRWCHVPWSIALWNFSDCIIHEEMSKIQNVFFMFEFRLGKKKILGCLSRSNAWSRVELKKFVMLKRSAILSKLSFLMKEPEVSKVKGEIFSKISSNHVFGELFWISETSGWLTQPANQIQKPTTFKKSSPKKGENMIWWGFFFGNNSWFTSSQNFSVDIVIFYT